MFVQAQAKFYPQVHLYVVMVVLFGLPFWGGLCHQQSEDGHSKIKNVTLALTWLALPC